MSDLDPRLSLLGFQLPDWYDDALCAQVDQELFWPERGGSTAEAKRVCRACPVVDQCLAYALANGEREGIWGGTSPTERKKMRRSAA